MDSGIESADETQHLPGTPSDDLCLPHAGGRSPPLSAQDLTITNARIIAANGAVIERGLIVVRAGTIVSVVLQGSHPAPSGRTIDAKGMTAMPGFIDAHRHINTGPNEKAQMQAQLEAGYTTILSGGGPADENITLRDHIDSGPSTDRGSFRPAP